MAESVREKILANIETSLREIAVLQVIGRGVLDPVDMRAYPAASILEASDDLTLPLLSGVAPFADRTLSIILRLWIASESDRSKKLNALLADVQKKIMEDPTRGGNAIDTLEGSNRNVYLEAEGAKEAGLDIDYQITYRTRLGDPYAAS